MLDRKTILVFLCTVILGTSSAPAQQRRIGPPLPTQRMLSRFGLERAWWSQATINPSRDKVRHISVDEENLYIQTTGGAVTGFDAETGKRLWSVQLGHRDEPSYAAVSNNNVIMIPAGTKLYGLNKFTGDLVWEIRLPEQPSTSPGADDDQVYIGTLGGSVFAFDIHIIRRLHNERKLPQYSHEAMKWRYKASKEISTPPVSTGRVVNFASLDGSLYSVTTKQRDLSWQFETDEPISAPLGVSNDSLFLAAEDFNVYCINKDSGYVRWEFISGFPVKKAPRVIGKDVYLLPQRGGLFSLSTFSGNQNWWRPGLTGFLAATRTQLLASDRIGNVVVLSRKDGSAYGSIPMRNFTARLSNDRTDRLYMATQSGLVVCIRERGKEFPTFHMYPDRLPIVPLFAPEDPAPAAGAAPPAAAPAANNNGM